MDILEKIMDVLMVIAGVFTPNRIAEIIVIFFISLSLVGVFTFTVEYKKNIHELLAAKQELSVKSEKLSGHYDELAATEEELRGQYDDIRRAQAATREIAQRYRLMTESAYDILWEWSPEIHSEIISDRFYGLMGYTREDFSTEYKSFADAIHPDDLPAFQEALKACTDGLTDYVAMEFRIKMKSGAYKWFLVHGKPYINSEGKTTRYAGSLSDITGKMLYREEIKQLAYFDYLTGLPNRTMLFEEAEKRILTGIKNNNSLALLHIDLDNFSAINDSFGHECGNGVLKMSAVRLGKLGSDFPDYIVGRLSGDEFIVMFSSPGTADAPETPMYIENSIKKVFDSFKETIQIENYSINPYCSMGISLFPNDGDNFDELLRKSNMAMNKAKNAGKNCYKFHDSFMDIEMADRLKMEIYLKTAVKNNEFQLYYQPQLNIKTGKLLGFEALIRWCSPVYGMVSPTNFIPLIEQTGLIVPIGNWVIEKTFEFAKKINFNCSEPLKISFNVSPTQLIQADFLNILENAAVKYQVDPKTIGIEITESTLLNSFGEVSEKINLLRKSGYIILLDDFGTGYSSLNYLKKLPVDIIKIDKSFVDDIEKNGMEKELMHSIISLIKSIGLKSVAEGVEIREQLEILTLYECDYIQGYHLSRPLPEEDVVEYLQSRQNAGSA